MEAKEFEAESHCADALALTECPWCKAEIYWVQIGNDEFAMCTQCTWGED